MFSKIDETTKMGTFEHLINLKIHFQLEINDAKRSLIQTTNRAHTQ